MAVKRSKSKVRLTIVRQCNGRKLNGLCFLEMISERIGSASRTNALAQMGLLSEEKVEKLGSPLDTISNHLASTLSYGPSERDMILMRHDVSKIVPKLSQKLSQKTFPKTVPKNCPKKLSPKTFPKNCSEIELWLFPAYIKGELEKSVHTLFVS